MLELTRRDLIKGSMMIAAGAAVARGMPLPKAFANTPQPPFDFSDGFYLTNGLDPAALLNRVNGADGASVIDGSNTDPDRRGVRVIDTTGGFNASAGIIFYNIMAMVMPGSFTNDDAGRRALAIANSFRAFLFPKRTGDPLSPAPPNRRQDNVFDTRDGYFSNNPLGLWILTFVSYTDAALTTRDGQKTLAALAAANGTDLDGTPILASASDIDNLAQAGFVNLRTRAFDGSQGFPWVV